MAEAGAAQQQMGSADRSAAAAADATMTTAAAAAAVQQQQAAKPAAAATADIHHTEADSSEMDNAPKAVESDPSKRYTRVRASVVFWAAPGGCCLHTCCVAS
jgi:hypothetical protein